MKSLFCALLSDEAGYILCAEAVVLGTVGVVGATVGLSSVSYSINEELKDVAFSIRSLDQSYSYGGLSGCNSRTAGSCFQQRSVEESHAELQQLIDEQEAYYERELQKEQDAQPGEAKPKKGNNSKGEGSKNKKEDSRWNDEL